MTKALRKRASENPEMFSVRRGTIVVSAKALLRDEKVKAQLRRLSLMFPYKRRQNKPTQSESAR